MDVLYHYCPTSSFHSIIQSRSIWLSLLTLSNDTMEGKLVTKTVTHLAERDGLDRDTISRLQDWLALLENEFDSFGFCLSEEGDLLSQWRGYAADATGVAIGFSEAYLQDVLTSTESEKPPVLNLERVEYTHQGHEEKVEPIYRKIRRHIDDGAFKLSGKRGLIDTRTDDEIEEERKRIDKSHTELVFTVLSLFPMLFQLKSHAFREEKEWRLISLFIQGVIDDCSYRSVSDRVIPYRIFKLSPAKHPPITEIVLGPKHNTPPHLVKSFLKKHGFEDVLVRHSEASYR